MTWAQTDRYPDLLVTGNDRGDVALWEYSNEVERINAGVAEVTSLAYGSATGMFASGAADGTVTLWDLATREACHQQAGSRTAAFACVLATGVDHHRLSADGRLLIGTRGVWSLTEHRPPLR